MIFRVYTVPALPEAPVWLETAKIDHLDLAVRAQREAFPELDLRFNVGDQTVSYYPASAEQCVIDLVDFLDALNVEGVKDVSLSGYPVMSMRIDGGVISFFDTNMEKISILGVVEIERVRRELLLCIGRILRALSLLPEKLEN